MTLTAFDLDGTLLTGNSSFLFCRYLYRRKVITRRQLLFCARLYLQHLFLGLSLATLHQRIFRALFQGKYVAALMPYVSPFIETHLNDLLYPPALARLRASSDVAILSNAPTFLVAPIAQKLGVSRYLGTEYNVDDQGRLAEIKALVDGKVKADYLAKWQGETVAYSDSRHDLPFLSAATRAIAVRPDRALRRAAVKNCWEILP